MTGAKSKAATAKSDSRLSVKKGAGVQKMSKAARKAAKDPDMPKRPASAFFVFMEEFRKQYKEEHPNNKSVAAVGKAGGEKWKSMSEQEKAPFVAKAEKRKTEYTKNMEAYNRKLAGEPDALEEEEKEREDEAVEEAESDKSKSEVHDDDDDDDAGDDESGEEYDD
uniref:HMG box domain-containing protein n=1 Tax=Kalanchoe fedtschenkoi TaxID=63787 RepID=A0A7N0VB61_KALFE